MVDYLANSKDSATANAIMTRIKRDLAKKPKRSDFEIPEGLSSVDMGEQNSKLTGSVSTAKDEFKEVYEELLRERVPDKRIKKNVIEYSEIFIHNNSMLVLKLKTSNEEEVTLKVLGVSPEYVNLYSNWWIGKEFDSQGLSNLIRQFKTEMRAYRIADVMLEGHISKSGRVISVSRSFVLA